MGVDKWINVGQWFESKHDATGRLSSKYDKTALLPVSISYPEVTPGPIKAIFSGSRRDSVDFLRVSRDLSMRFEARHGDERFHSDKVFVKDAPQVGWSDQRLNKLWRYPVCHAELDDLFIRRKYESKQGGVKRISFRLAGPANYWHVGTHSWPDFEGGIKVHSSPTVIDLSPIFPLSTKVDKWYIRKNFKEQRPLNVGTPIHFIEFETLPGNKSTSTERFVSLTKGLVDDLCLLCGFISSSPVDWYQYNLTSGKNYTTLIKSGSELDATEPSQFDQFLFDVSPIDSFYSTALAKLRELAASGLDLRIPIQYYIASAKELVDETKFSLLFLSLEKLKDLHLQRESKNHILEATDFKAVKTAIGKLLEDLVGDEEKKRLIAEKLGELNRYPLSFSLDELFGRYKVEVGDLYPSKTETRYPFVQVRNRLFHTSGTIDFERLWRESERLKILVQRLLLSMLGFKRIPIREGLGSYLKSQV